MNSQYSKSSIEKPTYEVIKQKMIERLNADHEKFN